ncbi:MAG: metal-dependent hydrolase [Phascolarctobacterium sp.]|uniref:metal-dependent hydrolase n=1 Tax=Phascolarctobacterium sp. TaxID=2049039 RepID=UPI0026DB62B5|nr:metal-dependent hydrolase [Phascolarctobacterium sp.]MDO4921276.1 metal-dependent hydrolase [Phascolarctobacterium sp.]
MSTAKFHYINHACCVVAKNNAAIVFDPYLDGNPQGLTAKDIKADYIFISHGHFDHLGSAFEIAKHCGATIISTAEIAALATEAGCQAHAMHIGGTYKFPFGKVRVTPAFHGAGVPGGHACGFVVDFYGTKLYFAGDTALFGDMRLLPRLDPFDYAVLPIGGNSTMGPQDAIIACEFLQAKYVIPIHYNTWPMLAQDVYAFKAEVESKTNCKALVVKQGETIDIE